MLEIEEIYYNQTTRYTSKWSNYFEIYTKYFNKFRTIPGPTVLEIGVDNGGSLQMWYEYFGSTCKLYGIDNRPKFDYYNAKEYLDFDVNLFIADQGEPAHLDNIVNLSPKFDIIIDDGSHFQEHQILTFKKLFPHMNEGGIYLVEDTHASYMDIFGGKRGKADTFIEFMKFAIDALHEDHDSTAPQEGWGSREGNLYRNIKSIHFYDSVVVIEKGLRPKNSVTYSNRETAI